MLFISILAALIAAQFQFPGEIPDGVKLPVQADIVNQYSSSRNINGGAKRPQISGCNSQGTWALTFDDGPTPDATQIVLDSLLANGAKATFFVLGKMVRRNPDMLKKIHDAGHEIGIHTWNHIELTTMNNDEIITDLILTQKAIAEVIGKTPRLVRAPKGSQNDRVLAVLQSLGMDLVYWSLDTNDWRSPTNVAPAISNWVKNSRKPGTITLQHDIVVSVAETARKGIELIKNAQYKFVTLSECSGVAAYVEDDGEATTTTTTTTTATATKTTTTDTVTPTSDEGTSVSARPTYLFYLFATLAVFLYNQ